MVVKNQIKLIKSLQQKKYRNQHGLFVVEGKKTVQEVLGSGIEVYKIFTTDPTFLDQANDAMELVTLGDLKQMSSLKNPNTVLGVFKETQLLELSRCNFGQNIIRNIEKI